jgi:hypothetical protein
MRQIWNAALRFATTLVLGLALTAPALAADKKKEGEAAPSGQFVDLVPMALPVIVDGTVRNYIFLKLRVNLTPGADPAKARDKEPYLRDALIHAGYRTPFNSSDTYIKLDEAKLTTALAQQARTIFGPRAVGQVVITSQDPLHVSNLGRPRSPP